MNLRFKILSKHSILVDGDIREINKLMKQLSTSAKRVSRDTIFKVIADARLAVAYDLGVPGTRGRCIVGMATLIRKPQLMGLSGFIEDVVVDEAYRGHGIAERLNLCLIEEAKMLGMKHLDLTSNPKRVIANKLYDKLGYVDRDTRVRRLDLSQK